MSDNERRVIKTYPTRQRHHADGPQLPIKKRRVAAYARVSTDDDEQLTSYENQVRHYTQYIRNHEGWEFAGVFTDEGITGTSTKHRDGFNAMVRAALAGDIDLIITKSVSRFARNTVDTLTTVRKLKEHGVEVYFEKENIFTLDSKGELLITIMSSLAQEESRSISENVTWGMRKRFADGKVTMSYKHFLGYRKGANGLPEIVPEEAETVRFIYRRYLEGCAPSHIASDLTAQGIPTPAGKPTWYVGTIISILTNVKYKGDAILQKTFCTDFLTKRFKINEGEVPQYYVHHSHPAIIDPKIFAAVQDEIQRRAASGRRKFTSHCFSGKVFCGECGGLYGSDSCRREITWRCNARHRLRTQCTTSTLRDQTLRDAFVLAFNRVIDNKAEIIDLCLGIMAERCDTSGIDREIAGLETEIGYISGLLEQHIASNTRETQDQAEYRQKYDEYERRYVDLNDRLAALEARRAALRSKQEGIQRYVDILRSNNRISTFDPTLCLNSVEKIIVFSGGMLRFEFLGGQIVEG